MPEAVAGVEAGRRDGPSNSRPAAVRADLPEVGEGDRFAGAATVGRGKGPPSPGVNAFLPGNLRKLVSVSFIRPPAGDRALPRFDRGPRPPVAGASIADIREFKWLK